MTNLYNRIVGAIVRRYKWLFVDPKARKQFHSLNILDSFDSIQYIIEHRCSVSRYGDGELAMIYGKNIGFQKASIELVNRLKHVLQITDAPNHIIGIPYYLKNVDGTVVLTRTFWGDFVCEYGKLIRPYLSEKRTYIDTQISRFYIEYHDYDRSTRQLEMLRKIWDGREVVIVEGTQSRTGVGNDLYDNAKSLRRILGYSTNGFSHYDEMLKAITSHVNPEDGKLILLSYGPTATILAYDLAKLGYQAVDIGHLDIEYEWYLRGTGNGGKVGGKYTNEAMGGSEVEECHDEKYLRQIVCDITREKHDL